MNSAVEQIGKMHFEGNLIPHNWYQTERLKLPNGKPNLVAITLLSDIVYWYRPTVIRDETTGHIVEVRQKFAGYRLQKSYRKWGQSFGFSQRQVEDAIAFLKQKGIIDVERQAVITEYGTLPNCAFIEPIPGVIEEMASPVITGDGSRQKGARRPGETGDGSRSSANATPPKRETIPKTSSKKNKEDQRAATPPGVSPAAVGEKSPEKIAADKRGAAQCLAELRAAAARSQRA